LIRMCPRASLKRLRKRLRIARMKTLSSCLTALCACMSKAKMTVKLPIKAITWSKLKPKQILRLQLLLLQLLKLLPQKHLFQAR